MDVFPQVGALLPSSHVRCCPLPWLYRGCIPGGRVAAFPLPAECGQRALLVGELLVTSPQVV
jgi:hypothetical protein